MLHVQDLPATVAFYEGLGFSTVERYDDDGDLTFAIMQFGNSLVMLNSGGTRGNGARRDADLYVYADVTELYPLLKDKVEIVTDLNDTSYGCREFTIRENNGFWLTFGSVISELGVA
jgi:catechol 2,3-dioxygenase-like lactoylglutathione lyase family enzyme